MNLDICGIKNVIEKELNFDYDRFYKEYGLILKKAEKEEVEEIREKKRNELDQLLCNINIDINTLKNDFIDILLNNKSSKYLWILYSKYDAGENYIDKMSGILKQENQVIRGGANTYKMNGWMAHSLYVYQIVNDNIANNAEIMNFNGKEENIEQIKELHNIYNQLDERSKFILKVFTLIHDIGVIEDIKFHDKLGTKYVEKVLNEIKINQETLNQKNILINLDDLSKTLKSLIKYHTLITSLSSESSDLYVENEYRKLLSELPDVEYVKNDLSKILLLMAYGDVTAVDESLMNLEKYRRIKDCYDFFYQISRGEKAKRNKEKVAVERFCDIIGESKVQNLENKINDILEKCNIEKNQFIEDMYNIKLMRYTGPLMKTLNDTKMSIKIFSELFELLRVLEGKNELKNYTIIFVPDKHENDFVEQFKNNNFFECINKMKENNEEEFTYGNINIKKGINVDGKYLHIRVV